MTFQNVEMKINKREGPEGDRKNTLLGSQTIYVPLLKDILKFVAEPGEQAVDEKTKQPIFEDGIPVYVSDEANWVQGALYSQARAQARNKIVPGTANLKPDQKIASTWEELCAEGERGQGAGFAILRECKADFNNWAKTQGLSEAAYASLTLLFANKNALTTQPQDIKDKVSKRVEDFIKSLDEAKLERYTRPLEGIAEATKPAEVGAMDF